MQEQKRIHEQVIDDLMAEIDVAKSQGILEESQDLTNKKALLEVGYPFAFRASSLLSPVADVLYVILINTEAQRTSIE